MVFADRAIGGFSPALARGMGTAPVETTARCGTLFQDLRWLTKLSKTELAIQCRTSPDVIDALETGDLARLTSWPETVRIIRAITLPLDIDPQPLIRVMGQCWDEFERRVAAARAPATPAPALRPHQSIPGFLRDPGRLPLSRQRLVDLVPLVTVPARAWRFALAIAIPALVVTAALSLAASGDMPAPLAMLYYKARDVVVETTAPVHDGLRWIDVDDPRTRRADKLPVERR